MYRLRARDAAFAPHELALLKQCETDVQMRAVTAGYVTGAGTHSALRVRLQEAPRLMLSVLAGACGAYAGVQSMARDCMRRVARLEDSRLAADARFVIRRVAPHDPLGREPAGARPPRGQAHVTRAGRERERNERRERNGRARATERARRRRGWRWRRRRRRRPRARLRRRVRMAMMRRVRVMRCAAVGASARAARRRRSGTNARRRNGRASAKASLGMNRGVRFETHPSPTAWRGAVARRGERGGGGARPARRRGARRRDDARNAGDENHAFAATELATPARDELIDPATRVSFGRGTRRTAYGDVLDQ